MVMSKVKRKILHVFFDIVETIIRNISGRLGIFLRRLYYSKRLAQCGKNLRIDEGLLFKGLSIFILVIMYG